MKPMYNVDDILARLQNGEKLEDIGNELANAMNAAQEKYVAIQKAEEEKRAAEAEKARQAQRTATRRKMLWNVLDAIRQYANYTNYSVVVNDWLAAATEEDIADLDAQMIELLKTFEMLSQLNFAVAPKQENIQKDTKKVAAVDPNKALGDFLKMMGW
jgi:hypothetical protein